MALTLVKKEPIANVNSPFEIRHSHLANLQRLGYKLTFLFRCWHWRMSRPFTRDGCTYCVCLRCGIRRNYDLDKWKMTGGYYYASDSSEYRKLFLVKGTKQ